MKFGEIHAAGNRQGKTLPDRRRAGAHSQRPSRISASPHTVLGTNAGAVFHSWPVSSTCLRLSRDASPVLSVRPLPRAGAYLQLLRRWLCAGGAASGPTRRGSALPDELPRRIAHALRARRYRQRQKNVTHQGSPPAPPDDLLSEDQAAANQPPSTGDFSRRPPWHCHWCGNRCPDFVRQDFLRRRRPQIERRGPKHEHSPEFPIQLR